MAKMVTPNLFTLRMPLLSIRVRGEWQKEKIFQVIKGKQFIRSYTEYDGSAKGHLIQFQSKFAAAVWNWQKLETELKAWFHSRASKLGLQYSGYNYFISLYMRDKLEDFMGYPDPHSLSHQKNGADELNVTGLVGTTPRAILLDALPGRVLRKSVVTISDGSNSDTIAVDVVARFNGIDLVKQDNIGKGHNGLYLQLSSDGHELIFKENVFPGQAVSVFSSTISINFRGVVLSLDGWCTGGEAHLAFFNASSGAAYDLTSLLSGRNIHAAFLIITSE